MAGGQIHPSAQFPAFFPSSPSPPLPTLPAKSLFVVAKTLYHWGSRSKRVVPSSVPTQSGEIAYLSTDGKPSLITLTLSSSQARLQRPALLHLCPRWAQQWEPALLLLPSPKQPHSSRGWRCPTTPRIDWGQPRIRYRHDVSVSEPLSRPGGWHWILQLLHSRHQSQDPLQLLKLFLLGCLALQPKRMHVQRQRRLLPLHRCLWHVLNLLLGEPGWVQLLCSQQLVQPVQLKCRLCCFCLTDHFGVWRHQCLQQPPKLPRS